jgi:pilus assembly protein Flp/PilA
MNAVLRLIKEEEGADATEYALLASLVAVALILGATALGTQLNLVLNSVQNKLIPAT